MVRERRLERSLIPLWLRAAILRGLRPDPAERHPSLRALLAELSRDRDQARRRGLAIGAVVLVAGGVAASVVLARRAAAPVCAGAEAKLGGVWDPPRRLAVESAFHATNKPYVSGTLAGVERILDDYAGSWVAAQDDACRATRVRGEQSAELLDLRTACLDARRENLGALVNVLSRADDKTVLRSVEAVSKLPDLQECANTSALKARIRPPSDPSTRARVEAARARVALARAQSDTGKHADAEPIAVAAAADAKEIGYAPLQAEASYVLGLVQRRGGKPKLAEVPLRRATLPRAPTTSRSRPALGSSSRAIGQDRWTRGRRAGLRAPRDRGDHDQVGRSEETQIEASSARRRRELLDHWRRVLDEARALLEGAIPLAESALGPESRALSGVLADLGIAYSRLARYARRGLRSCCARRRSA